MFLFSILHFHIIIDFLYPPANDRIIKSEANYVTSR